MVAQQRVYWDPPYRRWCGPRRQPAYQPVAVVLSVGKKTAHIRVVRHDGTYTQRYIKLSRLSPVERVKP